MVYDKVFITNLPSFYKINLYNMINQKKKIFVIFTGDDSDSRNADFFNEKKFFPFIIFNKRSVFYHIFYSFYLLRKIKYNEIVINGWNSLPLWIFAIFSKKRKNSIVIESSYIESKTNGLLGVLKKIFISRIGNKAYVSGLSQEKLANALNCTAKIIKTHGVGIFNYIPQPKYVPRKIVENFIYVGRLVDVKNLVFLVKVFNEIPEYKLTIVGFGDQEAYLKSIAANNIIFKGAVNNKNLSQLYQQNDVFILPSKSEVWGLVVEEALNNGLPVMVSNKVGCAEDVVSENVGLIFMYDSKIDLLNKIKIISNIEYYNKLRKNISKLDFEKKEMNQVSCYL